MSGVAKAAAPHRNGANYYIICNTLDQPAQQEGHHTAAIVFVQSTR